MALAPDPIFGPRRYAEEDVVANLQCCQPSRNTDPLNKYFGIFVDFVRRDLGFQSVQLVVVDQTDERRSVAEIGRNWKKSDLTTPQGQK